MNNENDGEEVARGASSLQRMVRPLRRDDKEGHADWHVRQCWRQNVQRLKRRVLNVLTLGLGENIWYGDCPHMHLDKSLLVVLLRLMRVNRNDLVTAPPVEMAGADKIAGTRNKAKDNRNVFVRIFGLNKADVVVGHKCVERPNDPSSATRPTRALACNREPMAGLEAMMG